MIDTARRVNRFNILILCLGGPFSRAALCIYPSTHRGMGIFPVVCSPLSPGTRISTKENHCFFALPSRCPARRQRHLYFPNTFIFAGPFQRHISLIQTLALQWFLYVNSGKPCLYGNPQNIRSQTGRTSALCALGRTQLLCSRN